jgi:hypothetical protein
MEVLSRKVLIWDDVAGISLGIAAAVVFLVSTTN